MGKFGPYITELVKLVGSTSAAADQGTVVTRFVVPIGVVGGGFGLTYSAATAGGTATLTAAAALVSLTTYVELFGYPK